MSVTKYNENTPIAVLKQRLKFRIITKVICVVLLGENFHCLLLQLLTICYEHGGRKHKNEHGQNIKSINKQSFLYFTLIAMP